MCNIIKESPVNKRREAEFCETGRTLTQFRRESIARPSSRETASKFQRLLSRRIVRFRAREVPRIIFRHRDMEIAFRPFSPLTDQRRLFTRSRLDVRSLSLSCQRIRTRWDRAAPRRVLVSTQSVAILRRILQDRGNAAGIVVGISQETRERAVLRYRSVGRSVNH